MEEKKPKFKWSYLLYAVVLIVLVYFMFFRSGYQGEYLERGYAEVLELVEGTHVADEETGETDKLSKVYYKDGVMYFLVEDSKYENSFPKNADYYLYYEQGDGLTEKIGDLIASKNIEGENFGFRSGEDGVNYWNIIYTVLYIGFGAFLVFMIFRMIGSSNKGAMSFGKSKARAYTTSKVRFDDIAGTEEEKEELKEIVEFLKSPKKFTDLGARIPKGVLLVGQPGTGKTLLARAVAGEANVPFISISGSDFVEMFVGVGASRVRDLFEQAKKSKPWIVFIDEIDAVGRQRGAGLGGGNDEREQTLNQLLVEMDGFESNEGIIVLAATNRSDVLDPALMRPGRFDRQVYVHVPDVKGREGILKIHAKNKPIDENVDFSTLAKITVGFTGADIENMLNEAAILAAREGRPKIIMSDITEGINKVTMGPQKKSRVITERDRKLTAYHEAGHAILAKKLKHTDEVQEVSIIPRGGAGGYTMQRPEDDKSYQTYNYLMDYIAICMGGRIAEELVMKDISTGASGDIQQASKVARNMVYLWGMSKNIGFISLDSSDQVFIGRDYQTRHEYSEKLGAEADDEVRSIIDYNYKRAKKVLTDNMDLLHEMANLLLDQETINKEEIDMLLEGKKAEEVAEIMKERVKLQKEKEAKIKAEQEEELKKKRFEEKIKEGERLVANGIITPEEFERIKTSYEAVIYGKKEEATSVKQGLSIEEEPVEENTKPVVEEKEEQKQDETPKKAGRKKNEAADKKEEEE